VNTCVHLRVANRFNLLCCACVVFVFVLCLMLSVARISGLSILESLLHELTFIILLQREMLMILLVNRWNLQTFLRKKMNSSQL